MVETQVAGNIGALFPFFSGALLDGNQIRDYIRHAYTHGLHVVLQVDDKSYGAIFEDGKPKVLGANGKKLEDMLPPSEPHPHFVKIDVYHDNHMLNQIFYDPKEGMYKIY